MSTYMIQDQRIRSVFFNIAARNEYQTKESILVKSFCDENMIECIHNVNHQIIQGRRGTGKTHVLRMLNHKLCQVENSLSMYIDCRTFGSATSIADESKDLLYRCQQLFKDMIYYVINEICKHINNSYEIESEQTFNKIQLLLDEIYHEISDSKKTIFQMSRVSENETSKEKSLSNSLDISAPAILKLGAKNRKDQSCSEKNKAEYTEILSDSLVFPNICGNINEITKLLNLNIYILIDEWSSIPMNVQPFFAEFLKRCFMTCPNIIIKIAVIDHRNQMSLRRNNQRIGLEIGSDIFVSLNLDQLFVYDNNSAKTIGYFISLLQKHLIASIGKKYIQENYGDYVLEKSNFLSHFFETNKTFIFLVRAAEGNARDFINIFTNCLKNTIGKQECRITVNCILDQAKFWFDFDKYNNITRESEILFNRIVNKVIEQEETRGFFIEQNLLESSDPLLDLIDARLLHYLSSGKSLAGNTCGRHTILLVDFGACAEFILTGHCTDLFAVDRSEKLCKRYKNKIIRPAPSYQLYDESRMIRKVCLTTTDIEI